MCIVQQKSLKKNNFQTAKCDDGIKKLKQITVISIMRKQIDLKVEHLKLSI